MRSKWSARLSLESLDGRIMPSGTPLDVPPEQPTTPVSTTAPTAARPIAQIQADIAAVTKLIEQTKVAIAAGEQKELALAVDVRLDRIGFEEAVKLSGQVVTNPNATPEQKLAALQIAIEAGIKLENSKAAYAAQVSANASMRQNLAGLQRMLDALKAELAAAQQQPTPVGTESGNTFEQWIVQLQQ